MQIKQMQSRLIDSLIELGVPLSTTWISLMIWNLSADAIYPDEVHVTPYGGGATDFLAFLLSYYIN